MSQNLPFPIFFSYMNRQKLRKISKSISAKVLDEISKKFGEKNTTPTRNKTNKNGPGKDKYLTYLFVYINIYIVTQIPQIHDYLWSLWFL